MGHGTRQPASARPGTFWINVPPLAELDLEGSGMAFGGSLRHKPRHTGRAEPPLVTRARQSPLRGLAASVSLRLLCPCSWVTGLRCAKWRPVRVMASPPSAHSFLVPSPGCHMEVARAQGGPLHRRRGLPAVRQPLASQLFSFLATPGHPAGQWPSKGQLGDVEKVSVPRKRMTEELILVTVQDEPEGGRGGRLIRLGLVSAQGLVAQLGDCVRVAQGRFMGTGWGPMSHG